LIGREPGAAEQSSSVSRQQLVPQRALTSKSGAVQAGELTDDKEAIAFGGCERS
jgi:hypothetical protein